MGSSRVRSGMAGIWGLTMPPMASICDILEAHLAVFVPCMTDQVIKIGPDMTPRSSEALGLQLRRHALEKQLAC